MPVLVLLLFGAQFVAAAPQIDYFPIKDLRPGLKATGYTIFSSVKGVEPFEVEILGKMSNQVGPGQDLIIARVLGDKFERSHVAAGMSGSPVYIDGKLVGALSYSFGQFTTDAIAGITPIGSMLAPSNSISTQTDLRRVSVPLILSGASPGISTMFAGEFARHGFAQPVIGAGGFTGNTSGQGSGDLRPGDAFSVILIGGDMNLSALGTVTWVQGKEFMGFGHGFLQTGFSELPVAKAEVVTTVFGKDQPYKMGQPSGEIGVLTGDRVSGVRGILGRKARTLPMTVEVGGKVWRYSLARTLKDTPFLAGMALSNSIALTQDHETGGTYTLDVSLKTSTGERLAYQRMVASTGMPIEPAAIASFMEPMQILQDQAFAQTELSEINLKVHHEAATKAAQLVAMSIEREPETGEFFELIAYAQPYRKPPERHLVTLRMPAIYAPVGYQIIALDRAGALALERDSAHWARVRDYADLVEKVRSMPKDTEVCIYAKQAAPVTSVMGTGLTELPISLKESFTNVAAGSEVLFNSQAVRLGCLDLGMVVTGKVSKSYGEKK